MLDIALSAAVPLYIQRFKDRGYPPTQEEIEQVRKALLPIIEAADSHLLYREPGNKGKIAKSFNQLAEGLAVMAFFPGGVRFSEQHWEAK